VKIKRIDNQHLLLGEKKCLQVLQIEREKSCVIDTAYLSLDVIDICKTHRPNEYGLALSRSGGLSFI
jgi:hypothetical protein